jgi:hypothetical protein
LKRRWTKQVTESNIIDGPQISYVDMDKVFLDFLKSGIHCVAFINNKGYISVYLFFCFSIFFHHAGEKDKKNFIIPSIAI